MNAGDQPRASRLVHLHLLQMVAGIDQHASVAVPAVFGGMPVAENDEGIVVVAAHASPGSEGGHAPGQPGALRGPLHGMPAVEMDHVPRSVGEVHAAGGGLFDHQRLLAPVHQPGGADDHVLPGEHVVQQLNLQPDHLVPHAQDQRLGLLRLPHLGQPRQLLAAPEDLISRVAQIHAAASVLGADLHRRQPEVAHPVPGVFLRQGVQGVSPVLLQLVGVPGEAAVGHAEQIVNFPAGLPAVIQMQHHAGGIRLDLIEGMLRGQRKDPRGFIQSNIHHDASFCTAPG